MQFKDLKQDKRNYRKHNQRNLDLIKKSVEEVGLGRSIVVDNENNIVCGNGLTSTLDKNTKIKVVETDGTELVVVKRTDLATDDLRRKQLAIMDNSASDSSEFDIELMKEDFEIEQLGDWGLDIETEDFDTQIENKDIIHQKLSDKFLIPPFDIFDARSQRWIERKKQWNSLIQDKAQARENSKVYSNIEYSNVNSAEVSILDAVLSEIINLWFVPFKGCNTLDCFAGDTVFGYVSSYLGNNFTGIELRQEQVDFNNKQTKELNAKYNVQ